MLSKALKSLKIILPIGLGVFLFWRTFRDPIRRADIFHSLQEVNLIPIVICLFIVLISHLSRAWRWKYLLEPLGYKTKFGNAFFSIMIGYVMNMLIPRAGEISRATFFSKYEKIPIEKTFGTIAAERVVDLFILLSITVTTLYTQRGVALTKATEMIQDKLNTVSLSNYINLFIGAGALLIIAVVFILKNPKIKNKISQIIQGLWEGLKSIFTTRYKWHFLMHTIIIWGCYVLMFYVPFFSIEATSTMGVGAVMIGFVFGSFSIVFTPGGTGSYHIAIAMALSLYGLAIETGEILGLAIWFAQAAFYIIGGLISLYLIHKTNDKYLGHTPSNYS